MIDSKLKLDCFKAYDVRGSLPTELNNEVAERTGYAYAKVLKPGQVVIGGDARSSSEMLKEGLVRGLRAAGTSVLDLGLAGTEEVYFSVFSQKLDGGIEVTGSHNPITDNGFKFVREESKPVSNDSGLKLIRQQAETTPCPAEEAKGSYSRVSFRNEYVDHILGYINPQKLKPLKIVVNPGNGAAAPVLNELEKRFLATGVPLSFIKVNYEPDGSFPNGIPNPLLPENRAATSEAVLQSGADMGLAWDGDFDRCFFFDNEGRFIEGYYMVGLLAESFLKKHPGAGIIHDPRLTWNTQDIVRRMGGRAIVCKTGHAFIKERMRQENAIYGGEMSAHHYFRDFAYCDSGMIPWLLVVELMAEKALPLARLVEDRMALFPCSGEINYRVADAPTILGRIEDSYSKKALLTDKTDGLSMEMKDWRFNVRISNTEPLLRLNVESRGNASLVQERREDLEKIILPR